MASSKVATGTGCKWFQTMVTIPAKSRGVHKITDYITSSKCVHGTFIIPVVYWQIYQKGIISHISRKACISKTFLRKDAFFRAINSF